MAARVHGGWTPASLLPGIAAGSSPGAAWSGTAPVQVSGNPVGQKIALMQSQNRKQMMSKVLGMPPRKGILARGVN